jgi:hypothetical protein
MDPSVRRKTESRRRSTCATVEHAKALSSQAARHAASGQTHDIGTGARDADDDTIADERHQQPDALDHELPAGAEEEGVQAPAPRLTGATGLWWVLRCDSWATLCFAVVGTRRSDDTARP